MRRRLGNVEARRPTYPDGRLIPIDGDKVHQIVPGAFGSAAVIHGVVFRSRSKLRVRIGGTSSIMGIGSAPVGRTYALDPHWTVDDDPEIGRREHRAIERKAAEERERMERERVAAEAVEAEATRQHLRRVMKLGDVRVGKPVMHIWSEGGSHGAGGVPNKLHVDRLLVTSIEPKYFVYIDPEGIERTSGNVGPMVDYFI
jgi:hypothetical protein